MEHGPVGYETAYNLQSNFVSYVSSLEDRSLSGMFNLNLCAVLLLPLQ